ncbi:hypothetical protein L7F22_018629 [Adiantum nelumboides]|nr:hypothetical protein [Adiantum nelumboides]
MATRSVTRAVQRAYQSPSRLFPFLVQQQLVCPAFQEDADKALHVSSSESAFSPFSDKISQKSWIPGSGLGSPLQRDAGKGHVSFLSLDTPISRATLSAHLDRQLPTLMQRPLSQDKVPMQDFAYCKPESIWKFTNLNYLPPSTEMDEAILPSQNEDSTSPMLMNTKRTFNPSTIVRKRRHGFLASRDHSDQNAAVISSFSSYTQKKSRTNQFHYLEFHFSSHTAEYCQLSVSLKLKETSVTIIQIEASVDKGVE